VDLDLFLSNSTAGEIGTAPRLDTRRDKAVLGQTHPSEMDCGRLDQEFGHRGKKTHHRDLSRPERVPVLIQIAL
jgi:hypothetical protein